MIERICLFDMDGTLCNYSLGLQKSMSLLASPGEPVYGEVADRDSLPDYLKARADLIRQDAEWWATLPQLKLGFDVWGIANVLDYRKMILTQGPKRNANAWAGKKMWIDRNLGQNVDITITRDKGLVYGKVLVDDWPEYIERWLEWRPRGLVIMPANEVNKTFKHPQVIRYDGNNYNEVRQAMEAATPQGDLGD
jgi:FMN phosphatase YigB (HAD superfamily)